MPNPTPQHNPTDGLGVAAEINLTGGVGGSAISTLVANQQYAITLSLSSAGTFHNTAALTAAIKDAKGNAYTPSGNAGSIAYVAPPTAGFFKPSNFGSYNARIVSVANSGGNGLTVTLTSVAVGQAVVEVNFPTFDNSEAATAEKVYALINVTVIP
jgi:hypothetical protein